MSVIDRFVDFHEYNIRKLQDAVRGRTRKQTNMTHQKGKAELQLAGVGASDDAPKDPAPVVAAKSAD